MTAPAVDHDADLDEQTIAELQPPCEWMPAPGCDQPATWIIRAYRERCSHDVSIALGCEAHKREIERLRPLLRCTDCKPLDVPLAVEFEPLNRRACGG